MKSWSGVVLQGMAERTLKTGYIRTDIKQAGIQHSDIRRQKESFASRLTPTVIAVVLQVQCGSGPAREGLSRGQSGCVRHLGQGVGHRPLQ